MKLHPQAIALSLLITSARSTGCPDVEQAAYKCIEVFFDEWSDDRKADLYALLAERVRPNMTMVDLQATVSRCLWDNENALAHG
jgi:hypothetical protein